MICDWQGLLRVLPPWMRTDVDRLGKNTLLELRLRIGSSPVLIGSDGIRRLQKKVFREDLVYCINTASRYSPWHAESSAFGYITSQGGHRIGICGEVILDKGAVRGIKEPSSLCIRVARDFPGIAIGLPKFGSLLILGSPCSGKTTLLRDLVRCRGRYSTNSVSVVDERGELFPEGADFQRDGAVDVLLGCKKSDGIDMLLRTMGPGTIAVDEITAEADCQALLRAGWCGVDLLATAHASGVEDLLSRPVYRPLVETNLFDTFAILNRDKSWRLERRKL